jgi:hypothetical protein
MIGPAQRHNSLQPPIPAIHRSPGEVSVYFQTESHCPRTEQKQLAAHRRMDGASEDVPTRSRHVKSDGRLLFRVEEDTPHTTAVHDDSVLFDLSRNPLKHG